jgi:hypothetical protein
MGTFAPAGQTWKEPDPFKRVKYSMGLILGVDEFDQDQDYFRERGHLHQRALHGYGTVSGLKVGWDSQQKLVTVAPGLAVDSRGRPVAVKREQAGRLQEWLQTPANLASLPPAGPEGYRSVYVLLAYAETESDKVPIPGPPGRSEEESVACSRLSESFELHFSPQPPSEPDEEHTRQLISLLGRVRPVATAGGITPEQMAQLVRDLPAAGEPCAGGAPIPVRPEQAEAVLEAALRTWVLELRRDLTAIRPPEQAPEGVLLARLDFMLGEDGSLAALTIIEQGRPFLLPTDLLQQSLIRQWGLRDGTAPAPPPYGGDAVAGGDLTGRYPAPMVSGLQGRRVAGTAPISGAVLTWDGVHGHWEPREPVHPGQGRRVEPFVTINRLPAAGEGPAVELWFHLPVDVATLPEPFEVQVYAEPGDGGGVRLPIPVIDLRPLGANRMLCVLDESAASRPHLRFEFRLLMEHGKGGRVLQRLMAETGVNWLGYDGHVTIVAFHYSQPFYAVVAAGVVEKGRLLKGRNLVVEERTPGLYLLSFPGFRRDEPYMVKGTPIVSATDYQRTFEVVREPAENGLLVRVPGFETGFMVEISRIL